MVRSVEGQEVLARRQGGVELPTVASQSTDA